MKLYLILLTALFGWAEVLYVDVPIPEYQISDNKIIMENSVYMHTPGAPNLPCKNVTIALPPGAIFEYATFYGTRQELGTFTIPPRQPILPLMNDDAIAAVWESYEIRKQRFYSNDRLYPESYGKVLSKGGLRKYTLVNIVCYPFAYRPISEKLYYTPYIKIALHYRMPHPESERAKFWRNLINDITFDEIARELIYNWNDAQIWYKTDMPRRADGYYIIIPASIQSSVDALVAHRQNQGYDVNVVTTEYIELNITGDDLAQKIRNYLRENMADIEYVLLVGHVSDLPMCQMVPFNNDPDSPYDDPDISPIPSDLYYAELTDPDSLSWNSDRDSYHGEVYDENMYPNGEDDPDYHADVHVGRIPISTQSTIEDICDKTIDFDSNTDLFYKTASLLAGGMIFFENENYSGYPRIDGADEMEQLMDDTIIERSNAVYLYEKAGLRACLYSCTDSLTRTSMISSWNRKGIVYEYNHGAPDSYARKIWAWDDGDSIAESNEMQWFTCLNQTDVNQLDNDYPATTFLRSCLCGKPEVFGLGLRLLHHGSSAVICGSRVVWVSLLDRGGVPYHFFDRLMKDTTSSHGIIGNAYDFSKNDFMDLTGFWINAYVFNLYGDPCLHQFGTLLSVEETQHNTHVPLFTIYPNPTFGSVTIQFNTFKGKNVEVDVYDESGRFVQQLHSGFVDEGTKKVDVDLATGVYFIRLKDRNKTQVKKFIVVH